MSRHSLESLDAVARTLFVAPTEFRALISDREQIVDVLFLVDVVAAFVHEFAVDPEWLLAGHYNAATHREALMLVEDPTAVGAHALRQFVRERYVKLRSTSMFAPPSLSKSIK